MESPNVLPATINIPGLLMSSVALISFWTLTIYGTRFQQLLCLSATLMIHTLCSISTLNQQLNNLEQTHIWCSLHYERWTVKGRDCKNFAIFQRNYLPDGRMNETVAKVEEFNDLWKPGAMDGTPLFVMNCNWIQVYLFVSLVWFLLFAGVRFMVFSKIYQFVPFLWWLEWAERSHWHF